MSATIIQFETGKTYSMRSICNHDSVWTYEIARRTKATITTTCGKTLRINKMLAAEFGVEKVFPEGRYSMAPVLSADRPVEK